MRRPVAVLSAWALLVVGIPAQDSPPGRRAVNPRAAHLPPSRLRGTVALEQPVAPACRATLCLFGEGLRGETALDPRAGAFDIPVEGGTGRFEWALLVPGFDLSRGSTEIRPGETADLGDVTLARGSSVLEGRVLDVEGRPVAGAAIHLHGKLSVAPGHKGEPENTMRTDLEGRFRIERVRAGRGFVGVSALGLPAIPAVPVETGPWERRWFDLYPVVGTIAIPVRAERGVWDRPVELTLVEEVQRMRMKVRVVPPRASEASGIGCGGWSVR